MTTHFGASVEVRLWGAKIPSERSARTADVMHFGASRLLFEPQQCVQGTRSDRGPENLMRCIGWTIRLQLLRRRDRHEACCTASREDETQFAGCACLGASRAARTANGRRGGSYRLRGGLDRRQSHRGICRGRQRVCDSAVGRAPGTDSSPRARFFLRSGYAACAVRNAAPYMRSSRFTLPERILVRSSRESGRSAIHFVPGGLGTNG